MVRDRDQLLLDVSHELRSPLTRMKVALAMLPDGDKKLRMEVDVAEMEAMLKELLERSVCGTARASPRASRSRRSCARRPRRFRIGRPEPGSPPRRAGSCAFDGEAAMRCATS
jgi:hypothetical protein